jgi:hypothetical protein
VGTVTRRRRVAPVVVLVFIAATLAAPFASSTAVFAAAAGTPSPPARALELVQPGGVEVAWSATGASSYEVAPMVGGEPCPDCAGAVVVGSGRTSVELASQGATVTGYAVRSEGHTGASGWVTARRPGVGGAPSGLSPAVAGSGSWTAQPVAGGATSSLDTAPIGWTRTIGRDGGFSAITANDGDLWVFGDTTVTDSSSSGSVRCFIRDGTAALAPLSLPPHLAEALQPVGSATAGGQADCSGDVGALPSSATEPYQLLPPSPGPSPGSVCDNWVNGLAGELNTVGGPTDGLAASYGSTCLDADNAIIGFDGTWVTGYQASGPGAQAVTMPLGSAGSPDLPPGTCPSDDTTSYAGGRATTGDYASILDFDGYDYFFEPFGNSTYAFASLGVPEATCSTMVLARVPAGDVPGASNPADFQYLLPGGRWVTSATSGIAQATLVAQSADIMPAGYDGAYAGQVDVSQLADGELAMVYALPAPVPDGTRGSDVAAIRTATSPSGPWSPPALFAIPGFDWGSDYQIVLHPELSSTSTLALSYVTVSGSNPTPLRQVAFATLDAAGLPAPGTPPATGYRQVASDGGIFAFGSAPFEGSMGGRSLNAPIVGMAAAPQGGGYWEVASDGGIFAFGTAPFYGSMGGRHLNSPVVGIAVPPTGKGYWEVAADGGLFAFGNAAFYGSMGGQVLNAPIVGLAAGPTGKGYWEVASDGGVFAFGDAAFHGSMGGRPLVSPVVAVAPTATGLGYWEVAGDGGVFSFGDAAFYGSMGGRPLAAPVVGVAADPSGGGYWEVASDGGVFAFGDAPFYGSMGGRPLVAPMRTMTVG